MTLTYTPVSSTSSYEQESYFLDVGPLGHIEGLTVTSHDRPVLRYFGGLPYALPPLGPYRFRSPRQLPPCYRYGPKANPGRFTGGTGICPQPPNRTPLDASQVDEDCLQLNIWAPAEATPKGGWPVLFYIHGGFLQWGNANWKPAALAPLIHESAFKAIVVLPSYRLNALGFLAGKELAAEAASSKSEHGNMGFHDQRMALEWTHKNISLFGGNPSNITVAGYSAGSHSTFQQLAHELYRVPDQKAIIKRAIMFSNSPGVQPRRVEEHQNQFDEFISKLNIPHDLPGPEKLARLRALPYEKLIDAQSNMKISEFRALSDGSWLPMDLISNINSGDFAARMKKRGITLLNGECRDEHNLYRNWRMPENSYEAVFTRLVADYPERVVSKLMKHYCGGSRDLPSGYESWQVLFGHIYADIQVHHLERGFHNALFNGGLEPGKDVLRYRFDRRLECVDATVPPSWEVTHSTDVPIWFWGLDYKPGMSEQEKKWLKGWNEGFAAFINGDKVNWGPTEPGEMRRWRSDGETDVWEDDQWDEGLAVWDLVNGEKEKASL
jgi:carboxylesterase type B